MRLVGAVFAATLLSPSLAHAAEPVRRIAVFVEPYYRAADADSGAPEIQTNKKYDALLASPRQEDILAIRDKIIAAPQSITPMTMMVLAIRLYDLGLRDDAAFWFYAAKDRFQTLAGVIDLDFDGLRQVEDTVHSFATLAGPVINGYAFCDVANQQAIRAKALAWVEANPYRVVFMEDVPATVDDRDVGLADAVRSIHAAADKETAYLADAGNLARLKDARAKNQADAKFCWK